MSCDAAAIRSACVEIRAFLAETGLPEAELDPWELVLAEAGQAGAGAVVRPFPFADFRQFGVGAAVGVDAPEPFAVGAVNDVLLDEMPHTPGRDPEPGTPRRSAMSFTPTACSRVTPSGCWSGARNRRTVPSSWRWVSSVRTRPTLLRRSLTSNTTRSRKCPWRPNSEIPGQDYGFVEVSLDAGANWTRLYRGDGSERRRLEPDAS